MRPTLGVLWVHGMGNHGPDYADGATEELQDRVRSAGVDPRKIAFKAAHWSSVLDSRENGLLRRMARCNDLDWMRLRRELVMGGLGDACAYLGPGVGKSHYYPLIHGRVEGALEELRDELAGGESAPVVIMAHSLGCAVVADYLMDSQKSRPGAKGSDPITRGETVASLVTFGCNLPLFALAQKPEDVDVPRLPGKAAADAFRDKAAFRRHAGWYNFYDPDDVLGFPLKPLSPVYNAAVKKDFAINTGAVLRAHTGYWTDNDFTRPVARHLAALASAVL